MFTLEKLPPLYVIYISEDKGKHWLPYDQKMTQEDAEACVDGVKRLTVWDAMYREYHALSPAEVAAKKAAEEKATKKAEEAAKKVAEETKKGPVINCNDVNADGVCILPAGHEGEHSRVKVETQ